ncbi:MAG: lytic murein transglycosylase, partial [Mesorhizobium sp.]
APAVAQQCGGDFQAWKQGVVAEAKNAGVGTAGLEALETAALDGKVLARDRAQGVFTQTFIEFSNRMISAYRLKQGAVILKKYADVFARADREFGVQAPVIAAFW